MNQAMQNLKHLPFGGASAVADPDVIASIQEWQTKTDVNHVLADTAINDIFLRKYQNWIRTSKTNRLDLSKFPVAAFSNGTSESFDKFYLRNHHRRFRCFRGEYMYHAAAWRNYFPNWCRIEDDDIRAQDAVVISMPFSDTGDAHPDMQAVLHQCEQWNVPVLIDCAFFGTCQNINFAFDFECITDVTFSLSKAFPVAHARIGMRLTRIDDDDSLLVHHKTNYTNRLGAHFGTHLIDNFDADFNVSKWHVSQSYLCEKLSIVASNTVLFGLAHDNFEEYNRGGPTNRLCLAKYLPSGELP
jgi:hypothetical protein